MSQPVWRKSSRSTTQGGECVEVADLSGAVGIRDSKNPAGGNLSLSGRGFASLVGRVKRNELDR